ncbi:hypothetical protein NKH77_25345 [Streptomyces sp. M19]
MTSFRTDSTPSRDRRPAASTTGVEEEFLLVDAERLRLATAAEKVLALADNGDGTVHDEGTCCQVESATPWPPPWTSWPGIWPPSGCVSPTPPPRTAAASSPGRRCSPWRARRRCGTRPGGSSRRPGTGADRHPDRLRLPRPRRHTGPRHRREGGHPHTPLAAHPARPRRQLALLGRPGHRLRELARGDLDALAHGGPAPVFSGAADYRRAVDTLLDTGAALDRRMVYWDMRPSASWPTLEVRVADVSSTVEEAVLQAALVRALVATARDAVREGARRRPYATTSSPSRAGAPPATGSKGRPSIRGPPRPVRPSTWPENSSNSSAPRWSRRTTTRAWPSRSTGCAVAARARRGSGARTSGADGWRTRCGCWPTRPRAADVRALRAREQGPARGTWTRHAEQAPGTRRRPARVHASRASGAAVTASASVGTTRQTAVRRVRARARAGQDVVNAVVRTSS